MRLTRALALSLAVHAALLLILWQRQAPPRSQAAGPLSVRLLTEPAPRTAPAEPGSVKQSASPLPPPSATAPPVPARRIDWREAARAVLRESATAPSPFLAPPLDRPAFGSGRAAASPELSNAFRPLPRARKICGDAEGIVDLGIRQIRMPVTRPCKNKEEEWRSPGDMRQR